jgi:hypothetical protein
MKELYPEKEELLKKQAKKIEEMGATPEEIERMKTLGYL